MADRYRYGEVTGNEPDLAVYKPEFAASRVTYRYIHPDSCELVEQAVGASGDKFHEAIARDRLADIRRRQRPSYSQSRGQT